MPFKLHVWALWVILYSRVGPGPQTTSLQQLLMDSTTAHWICNFVQVTAQEPEHEEFGSRDHAERKPDKPLGTERCTANGTVVGTVANLAISTSDVQLEVHKCSPFVKDCNFCRHGQNSKDA